MKKLTAAQIKRIERDNREQKTTNELYVKVHSIVTRDTFNGSGNTRLCPTCEAPLGWRDIEFMHCCPWSTFSWLDAWEIVYGVAPISLWEVSA